MNYLKYTITKKFNNYKIKDFFSYHKVSKKRIYEYTFKDLLKVNNNYVSMDYVLQENDELLILNKEEVDYLPYDKKIDILYENNYLLIVNKPKDIIIHPDDKTKNNTLVNMVANYFLTNNIKTNVRFIHRLDYQTTGIIVFVKDFIMSSYYDYLLRENKITRYYLALVSGIVKKNTDILEYKIGKDRHHNQRRRVSHNGVEAITYYEVISRHSNFTLVKLKLETGRTHQIRVHMSYINHPLVGDSLYNSEINYSRVLLHSFLLKIPLPLSNDLFELKCSMPKDMDLFIKNN